MAAAVVTTTCSSASTTVTRSVVSATTRRNNHYRLTAAASRSRGTSTTAATFNDQLVLLYPLSLKYHNPPPDGDESSSSFVRITGLTPMPISPDHLRPGMRLCESVHGTAMRTAHVDVPCTFNLYLLLPAEEGVDDAGAAATGRFTVISARNDNDTMRLRILLDSFLETRQASRLLRRTQPSVDGRSSVAQQQQQNILGGAATPAWSDDPLGSSMIASSTSSPLSSSSSSSSSSKRKSGDAYGAHVRSVRRKPAAPGGTNAMLAVAAGSSAARGGSVSGPPPPPPPPASSASRGGGHAAGTVPMMTEQQRARRRRVVARRRNEHSYTIERLPIENVCANATSLYEFLNHLPPRFAHEHHDGSASAGEEPTSSFAVAGQLVRVCFHSSYTFNDTLAHLRANATTNAHLYRVLAAQENEALRFSLDMFFRNERLRRESEMLRMREEICRSFYGSRKSDLFDRFRASSGDGFGADEQATGDTTTATMRIDAAAARTSSRGGVGDGPVGWSVSSTRHTRQQQFVSFVQRQTTTARRQQASRLASSSSSSSSSQSKAGDGAQCRSTEGMAADNDDDGGHHKQQQQQQRAGDGGSSSTTRPLDIYATFSFGHWILYRAHDELACRVPDLDAFVQLYQQTRDVGNDDHGGSDPTTNARLLFETPLVFVPYLVWDIETIARNAGTVPRGVSADERLVSAAVHVQMPGRTARKRCFVWAYTPPTMPAEARRRVARDRLLRDDENEEPVVLRTYTDERALLFDFCAALVTQWPLLYSYYGIAEPRLHRYRRLASFLVGHNTVGYDFSFVVNRCLFFDMSSLAEQLTRRVSAPCDRGGSAWSSWSSSPTPPLAAAADCFPTDDLAFTYTFNDAQICVDTMLLLMARMRHLSSFDLGSVLATYRCDVSKGKFDAVSIRFVYNELLYGDRPTTVVAAAGQQTPDHHPSHQHDEERLASFFHDFLLYNVYDCLSLNSLLDKLSLPHFVGTVMQFFHTSFEHACYRGNSKLLPNLFVGQMLLQNREVLTLRFPRVSLLSVDSRHRDLARLQLELDRLIERAGLPVRVFLEAYAFSGHDVGDMLVSARAPCSAAAATTVVPAPSRRTALAPLVDTFLDYARPFRGHVRLTTRPSGTAAHGSPSPRCLWTVGSGHLNSPLDAHDTLAAAAVANAESCPVARALRGEYVVPCESELDLLRVGEKTYIGGLNYADACHVKHPILMDYNSFYPSIIRHYDLDMDNVCVTTVLKLLLTVRPLRRLQDCLRHRVLRVFDYTPVSCADAMVNREVFSRPEFDAVFRPVPYARREWYEGIELDSVELLLASSRSLQRRLLVIMRKPSGSTVSRVVTEALQRRAVWKRLRKNNPDDRVLESRDLMEKLLANGTYGYLNFVNSVIYSRATAAAVTLLCRNAFTRTRFILESEELLSRVGLDPARFQVRVNYIDTDGCIVSVHHRCRQQRRSTDTRSAGPNAAAAPLTLLNLVRGRDHQPRRGDTTTVVIDAPTFAVVDPSAAGAATTTPASAPWTAALAQKRECGQQRSRTATAAANAEQQPQRRTLVNVEPGEFVKWSTEWKERFVHQVNDMLGMQHVLLAAEEHEAVAASVFGRKKYVLLKCYAPTTAATTGACDGPRFALKKTGFEKNAARPIKLIYDRLLNSAMRINHTLGHVHHDRFTCKIVRHRLVVYAILDRLYEMWRTAVRAAASADGGTKGAAAGGVTLLDFTTRVPLNPRDTGGKLAAFIDSTLRKHRYNPGDRVRVMKVIDLRRMRPPPTDNGPAGVDEARRRRVFPDATGRNRLVLYNANDYEFVLFDEVKANLDAYTIDLKTFLGGHLTYMYQCIEGCQTLRGNDHNEAIAWRTEAELRAHLRRLESEHGLRAPLSLGRPGDADGPASGAAVTDGSGRAVGTIYMKTLRGITALFYACWLWERVLAPVHSAAAAADASGRWWGLLWKDTHAGALSCGPGGADETPFARKLRKEMQTVDLGIVDPENDPSHRRVLPTFAANTSRVPAGPPAIITQRFFDQWIGGEESSSPLVAAHNGGGGGASSKGQQRSQQQQRRTTVDVVRDTLVGGDDDTLPRSVVEFLASQTVLYRATITAPDDAIADELATASGARSE